MAQVIWTEPALEELDEIADYISLDDPAAAKRLVRKVFRRIGQLREFPELGPCPKELRGTEYRHLVVKPLRIFYRADAKKVFILYVMRGEGERLFRMGELTSQEV